MSKTLKIIGTVVAIAAIVVAAVPTGGGSIALATAAVPGLGVAAGTVSIAAAGLTSASIFGLSVGTLTAIAGGLSLASSLLAPKPQAGSTGGSATDWKADPGAGVPYAIGRTLVGGNIVARGSYGGAQNPLQMMVTVYTAAGPIGGYETILVDKVPTTFGAGGAASGALNNYLWFTTQLGAQPEATALSPAQGAIAGWDGASKLSGYAASVMTLKWDKDGKKYPSGEPKQGVIAKWVRVYDPRLDSTYSGGLGPQRASDEATWAWSANPWLHALTWAIGRRSNGIRTVGVGMALAGIDIASYVEAANVADANGWTLGGLVYSTDDKWNAIKQMAQAGGGFPIRHGGKLSAFVNRPRVALLTLTENDLAGGVKLTGMQTRRARINGIIPRCRSEAHDWETISGDVVRSPTYLAEDGEARTREVDYPLVQVEAGSAGKQPAQLAAYDVADGREIAPISIVCKVSALALRAGDCVNLLMPTVGLVNRLAIVMRREVDLATGRVTLVIRSETTSKHAYCLGLTAVAPPTAALSTGDAGVIAANVAAQQAAVVAGQLIAASYTDYGLKITATEAGVVSIPAHARQYSDKAVAVAAGSVSGQIAGGVSIYYDDADRAGGSVAYAATTTPGDAVQSAAHPVRHYVGYVAVPAAGAPPSTGGGASPPGAGGNGWRMPQQ